MVTMTEPLTVKGCFFILKTVLELYAKQNNLHLEVFTDEATRKFIYELTDADGNSVPLPTA